MIYLLLSLLPTALLAQDGEQRFRRDLFAVLYESFSSVQPSRSDELLAKLERQSGVPAADLRPRLLALLDSLEAARQRKGESWRQLISQGEPDIGAERAGKLLRYLSREARNVLAGEGDFLLDGKVRKAARKAKVPFFQSRTFILRALDWALAGAGSGAGDEPVGLLVGGHSNRFEVALDPLFVFFDTQDEAFVREQVREVQRFIVPALVRRLPESARIRWAVRERESNALVLPDYHLRVGVDNIRFAGTNADLRPCVELSVELVDWARKTLRVQEPFSFCSQANSSATTSELAPFWDEVAAALRARLDQHLARLGRPAQ